ncbi:7TM-DISM domain-containing protein [Puia dinghuensis]|uniref:7TM-DISM receptor extracellular domain-containing protein n=1 Tax=Puia dinghuensis TaxID=1792502 RepID=A0A8J2UIL0_9BACT|nr:7TM-DISM domain-containing protein [Puia dinghuensis]GGB23019.1 hypothetical protein GCM10011511_53670 [Puia dinghuensis]
MTPTSLTAILACVISVSAAAQSVKPVLYLREHNIEHLSEYYTYWLQPFDEPGQPELADAQYRRGAFVYGDWHKPLKVSGARQRLWVRMTVVNTDSGNSHFVWSCPDFVDAATLFRSTPIGFVKVSTGTCWDIASRRGFPTRPLCLPFSLAYGEMTALYLAIDEHSDTRSFFLDIQPTADLMQAEQRFVFDRHWFWLFGLYVFGCVFSLILFAALRDRFYLWSFGFVLLSTVFLLMEDNLDGLILPQWLYTAIRHVGQYNFLLLGSATGIRMMQAFVRQRVRSPRIYSIGTGLIGLSLLYVLFTIVLQNRFPLARLTASPLINWGRAGVIGVNLTFTMGSLLLAAVQRNRAAIYYGITFCFFFFSGALFLCDQLGIRSFNLMQPNVLAWGLFFQLLTLSVLLTGRFRYRTARAAVRAVRAAA